MIENIGLHLKCIGWTFAICVAYLVSAYVWMDLLGQSSLPYTLGFLATPASVPFLVVWVIGMRRIMGD